ncbi:MAG: hypothetical protein ACFCVD_20010 [Nodosilinea sp.]
MVLQNLRRPTLVFLGLALALAPLALAPLACTTRPEPARLDSSPTTIDAPLADALGQDQSSSLEVALTGDGIQLVVGQSGSTDTFEFGTEMALVQNAITQTLGQPQESAQNDECPSGPLMVTTWPNGLSLSAASDQFVGWSVRSGNGQASLTTIAGIGLGSTRAQLEGVYRVEIFASSLGTEFSAGGLAGLLSSTEPSGAITHLWAGETCIFR